MSGSLPLEPTRNNVFISYSPQDRSYFDELQTYLRPVLRSQEITIWENTQILPGDNWREETRRALASARVAVLLVSQNFLASDFIHEHEFLPLLNAARNEGLTIIWILISPCTYTDTEIDQYQAAYPLDRPLSELNPPERARAFVQIRNAITRAIAPPTPIPIPIPIPPPPIPPRRPPTAAVLLGFAVVLVGLTIKLVSMGAGSQPDINRSNVPTSMGADSDLVISRGDRPVIRGTQPIAKSNAMNAYRDGEWDNAIQYFISSLQQQGNDPESWVYLNNAIAEWSASNQIGKRLDVALTVPTQPDSERLRAIRNENIPEELLRGAALQQTAFNCGIKTLTDAVKKGSLTLNECKGTAGLDGNQKFVHVTVADDRDVETSTKDLAPIIASQTEILGIIGHFSSGNCRVSSEIYKQKQLVSISPTCSSTELSGTSPYFFRTTLSDAIAAEKLYKYVADYPDLTTAIAFDKDSEYSKSFKAAFGKLLPSRAYKEECPLESNFNTSDCARKVSNKGLQFFVLVPSTTDMLTTLLPILEPLHNSGIIPLGADSVYNPRTVDDFGQIAAEAGLLISVPWHPRRGYPTQFELDSQQMFGTASVNWRTQSTFDAMSALTTGLRQLKNSNPTRQELRDIIAQSKFAADGVLGKNSVQFDDNGDRYIPAELSDEIGVIVKVKKKPESEKKSESNYWFVRADE